MRLVNVYAYKDESLNGKYRVLQMPLARKEDGSADWSKGAKPMIFPSIWVERFDNGKCIKKSRKIVPDLYANVNYKNCIYTSDELKGRTLEQADASEAFDQTTTAHAAMPITTSHGLFHHKLMVVTIDLDNLEGVVSHPSKDRPIPYAFEDAIPLVLSANERWEQKDWVILKSAKWIQDNPKAVAEFNATKIIEDNSATFSNNVVITIKKEEPVTSESTSPAVVFSIIKQEKDSLPQVKLESNTTLNLKLK